jgi:hypothetical protein
LTQAERRLVSRILRPAQEQRQEKVMHDTHD